MIGTVEEEYRRTLSGYGADLLRETARRAARHAKAKAAKDAREQLESVLANKRTLAKIVAELTESQRQALALFCRSPYVYWRWDHATRLLAACDIPSPYRTLQELLTTGLLCMRPARDGDALARFEIADGLPREALPSIAIAAPILGQDLGLAAPVPPLTGIEAPTKGWREADGWELPVRLALFWRIAARAPIKRTQQNLLFKRDRERIVKDPLLASSMQDSQVPLEDLGMLVYDLAARQGWLVAEGDEQSPNGPLAQTWPGDLEALLLSIARDYLAVENWNELGKRTPVGTFASEVSSARFLLLLWLDTLPADRATTVDELAERLTGCHPPWNAQGEIVGPFRQPQHRTRLAREWTAGCVLGPLYQCGLVAIGVNGKESPAVRLSALGRRFLGASATEPTRPRYPRTLLAQPNHEVIVYRQGLDVELLSSLVCFAEPKSLGAALTFEINADSVYRGLEAGMTGDSMIAVLESGGNRELPSGLAESIRTWSQKRDRLAVYADVAIFEFADPADRSEAVGRGMDGTPVGDRWVLIAADQEASFKNLRITASRDYRFSPDQCVEAGPDGVTLKVDLEKSDLMLESELTRFAEPLEFRDREGRRQFRVTANSLAQAFQQGWRIEHVEEWYRQRTGAPPPPAVGLLFRAAAGLNLATHKVLLVRAESPAVAEGLLQHPLTAELWEERLGPAALTIAEANLPKLREALANLGIDLEADPRDAEEIEE